LNLNATVTTMKKKARIKESYHHPSMTALTTAELYLAVVVMMMMMSSKEKRDRSSSIIPTTIGSTSDYYDDYVKVLDSITIEKGKTETIERPLNEPSSYSIINGISGSTYDTVINAASHQDGQLYFGGMNIETFNQEQVTELFQEYGVVSDCHVSTLNRDVPVDIPLLPC